MGINGKYRIQTKKGYITYVSAWEIYESIRKNKEIPFNIISLVEIFCSPNFSAEYSKKLKIFILEYFAKVKPELSSDEQKAMYKCYNSLLDPDKKCITAKRRFLYSLIEIISENKLKFKSEEARKEWVTEKYEKYKMEKSISYNFEVTILK